MDFAVGEGKGAGTGGADRPLDPELEHQPGLTVTA
jgi:hypothetical protein